MPFGDGTGPRGMGPMTGRGAGYCSGRAGAGFLNWRGMFGFNQVPGRGAGRGRGGGRGIVRYGFNTSRNRSRWY